MNPLLTPEFEMLAGTGDVRALTSSKVRPSCFATRHLCLHGVGGVLLQHYGLMVSETIAHAVANEKLAFIGKPVCPPKHSKFEFLPDESPESFCIVTQAQHAVARNG